MLVKCDHKGILSQFRRQIKMEALGIDVGGTGIKGAPVNRDTGAMLNPRYRIPTPRPAKPNAVAEAVAQVVRHFGWQGPVGCGFPSVIRGGMTMTAANIHKKWIGTNAAELFTQATGCPTCLINDADAAGLAEMAFGAGKDRLGTVLMVTIGTGLGTALFTNGQLLPNTELGHIQIDGRDAEWGASDAARRREKLGWKEWAQRFDRYLRALEALVWPDLIILGGGTIKKAEKFFPYLTVQAEVVPAQLLNEAGIVGAALAVLN
jgi:polyphosphate glucokinase